MKLILMAMLLGFAACTTQHGYVDSPCPYAVTLSPSHPEDAGLTLISISKTGVVVLALPSGERVTAARPGENFAHADGHSWAIPILRSVDPHSHSAVVEVLNFG